MEKDIIMKTYIVKNSSLYKDTTRSNMFLLVVGVIIGFINGFWGGGGGMLCVPALSYVVGLNEKNAHATTILIMLPLCIASFVIYVLGGYFEFDKTWTTGIGFVVGGLIGAYLLNGLNNIVLKFIFSIVVLFSGIWLII
ncbi:MAG: sulfite exporter TauE/SafE family protein [Clostridiales bacterium]|nr:sulfite exporter TauE/SafE family protein [Clostridiales bacterium]